MNQRRPDGARRPNGGGETTYYVLGETHLGAAVADRLRAAGHAVEALETTDDPAAGANAADPDALAAVDLPADATVVVATDSDGRNLLAAQHARGRLDADRVVVLASTPARVDAFADAGHDPVCVTSVLSAAIVDSL